MRWIIGDVHGMLRPLEALLEAISRADAQPRLYFAGDYVNRGPDAKGVIDLLLSLPNARFIRGNHDDVFQEILTGDSYTATGSGGDPLLTFLWFMQYGLDQTLTGYGADPRELRRLARSPDANSLNTILAAVPETHRRFICDLPPVIEDDDLFVAHGWWDPMQPDHSPGLSERLAASVQRRQRVLWGRFERDEIQQLKAWKRIGYFGHTPVEVYGDSQQLPLLGPNIVLLDTGAALNSGGRLTAFCHETQTFLQSDRTGRIVTNGATP